MGRTVKNRNAPHPKPVRKIELSEKHPKRRLAAAVVLLAIGGAAFAYAYFSSVKVDPGWREIKASSSSETDCGDEFVFLYYLGGSGISATAENKAVTALYTEAVETAYKLFNNDQGYDGINNVYYINQHVNEEIAVDEVLYQAFSLLQDYSNRCLYMAPVYARYDNLFYCNDDSEIVNYDPYLNEDVRAEFAEIAAYANDAGAVELQLLGENKIRLYVSEEYLNYAQENYITDFIDFYWMKNAFIVDYLAEVMTSARYTLGSVSSYDGFSRNLDGSDTSYSFNIYDRVEQGIYPAAVMQYTKPMSIVYLRNYMMNSLDTRHYYELKNGEIRTAYIDAQDGLCRSAVNNLVSYSRNAGCAEVLLQIIPYYIADTFQEEQTLALAKEGIYSIYCKERVIYYNEASLVLSNLYTGNGVNYTTVFAGED